MADEEGEPRYRCPPLYAFEADGLLSLRASMTTMFSLSARPNSLRMPVTFV
jgi:hypothetical protein